MSVPDLTSDLSFQHLQLEMARLDILLHRQIQRFQQGQTPPEVDAPLSLYHLSANQVVALLQRPFGHGPAHLSAADDAPYAAALAALEGQIAALVSHAEAVGEPLRLHRLAALLGLDRFALDAFLISLAPQLDGRYGKVYAFLQDDLTRKRPSINLVLDLLCDPQPGRLLHLAHFRDDGPLLRQRVVSLEAEPGSHHPPLWELALLPDAALANWVLLGQYQPPPELRDHLRMEGAPRPDLHLLPPQTAVSLAPLAAGEEILLLCGRDALAQAVAASALARLAQRPLLTLDLANALPPEIAPLTAVRLLLRDAQLLNAIPQITGWDHTLLDGAPAPDLLAAVWAYPGMVLIAGEAKWQPQGLARTRHLRWLQFDLPDTGQRQRLLAHFLAGELADTDLDMVAFAGQFVLSTGQLRDMVNTARDMAAQNGRALHHADLFAAARAHSNPRLASLARKITPRYSWDDLILPPDQVELLREMVATVRQRPLVLETWGVGQKLAASAGVTGLFFGQPGTGKTMAAEVLAGELGLDLYKIDLSSMVSKYIGETEKNLERIFSEAESSNAILFFDEADAIFGKRSEVKDAHDRYANIEISYLLQRMEAYDGVTILATNLRNNLDDAFMRRLQFALDFPFPKAADRLRIWQALFPSDVPRSADVDLGLMAERFDIAGGNIRNILVTAAYLAAANGQVLTMEHLLHGTRRELQKMGRLVNERDLLIHSGR